MVDHLRSVARSRRMSAEMEEAATHRFASRPPAVWSVPFLRSHPRRRARLRQRHPAFVTASSREVQGTPDRDGFPGGARSFALTLWHSPGYPVSTHRPRVL